MIDVPLSIRRLSVPERIRVMRIIARLNVGGPALHATILTERLDPERYESVLVTGVEGSTEANYLTLHGKSIERLVVLERLGRELRGGRDLVVLLQMIRLMRRLRPHVVHTHTAKAGALGRLAALVTRVPVILHTYHGHVLHGYFSPARTRAFMAIERALARWTTCLVAVSQSVRAELLRLGIGTPEQVVVVPLGLELAPFVHCDGWRACDRGNNRNA